jgi:hypothetical protein
MISAAVMQLPKVVLPRDGAALTFLAANGTGVSGVANATGTGTGATPTATFKPDTSCGESGSFTMKLSQADVPWDGWYLKNSGNGILFTSEGDKATKFSVESTGHLCVVGKGTEETGPYIAGIEGRNGKSSSPVWFMGTTFVEDQMPFFKPLDCQQGSNGLACAQGEMGRWIGCGLQLAITELDGATVPLNGLNCTSLSLSMT